MRIAWLPLCALIPLLCGCGDERSAPGIIITSDGRFLDNSATTARDEVIRAIRASLERDLGAGWTAEIAITEEPEYLANPVGDGDWRWTACTARVTLAGPGTPKIASEEIRAGVERFLRKRLRRSGDPLTVTVAVVAVAATAPVAPATPAPAGPRTYRIQTGDTLADISTVFYGSADHWRAILAANPGLAADRLEPGREIVIPAK